MSVRQTQLDDKVISLPMLASMIARCLIYRKRTRLNGKELSEIWCSFLLDDALFNNWRLYNIFTLEPVPPGKSRHELNSTQLVVGIGPVIEWLLGYGDIYKPVVDDLIKTYRIEIGTAESKAATNDANEPSPKARNSYLRTIEALCQALIGVDALAQPKAADAVLAALAKADVNAPVGVKTLSNYLTDAKKLRG